MASYTQDTEFLPMINQLSYDGIGKLFVSLLEFAEKGTSEKRPIKDADTMYYDCLYKLMTDRIKREAENRASVSLQRTIAAKMRHENKEL